MLVFLLSAAMFAYITAGYPLLLSVLAKRNKQRVRTGGSLRPVSIVIPVHNGENLLRRKLDSVVSLSYPKDLVQVLVVSDGSTDRTREIALEFAAQNVELLAIPRSGKAAALNAAIQRTTGELLILTDARQDLQPDSLRYLVESFDDERVGVVSGELRLRTGITRDEADVGLYWRYETWIRQNLSDLDSMFGATGPFYAIRRELYTPIPEDILLDDMYLPLQAFLKGYRLVVEPRAVAWDYPMTREREFNRKVRTLGGNYQLLLRMPQLLSGANRMLWHFLSYKVGRLGLPWITLALFVSSLTLPAPWNWLLAAGEAGFICLALVDPAVPQRTALKGLSSPARTFLVLMAAEVKGLKILFVPSRSLWKVTDIAGDS